MSNIGFPEKVTAESIPRLIEIGHTIENLKPWWARRHRSFKARIAVGFAWFLILVLTGISTPFLWIGWLYLLLRLGYVVIVGVDVALLMSATLTAIVVLIFIILIRDTFLPRFYPSPNLMVFCELVEISECMLNKKRKDAVKALYHLGRALRKYFRTSNELKSALENEMQQFNSIAFDRLILFSKDTKIPNLFLNLGLAFAKEDEPMIYSNAVYICKKIKNFNGNIGKSRGLWFFLEDHAKSIGLLVALVSVTVNVILTILYVFGIIPIPPRVSLPSS